MRTFCPFTVQNIGFILTFVLTGRVFFNAKRSSPWYGGRKSLEKLRQKNGDESSENPNKISQKLTPRNPRKNGVFV
jgi:hypothetical protein